MTCAFILTVPLMPNQPKSRPLSRDRLTHWPLYLPLTALSQSLAPLLPLTTPLPKPLCCPIDQRHLVEDTAHSNVSTDSYRTPVCRFFLAPLATVVLCISDIIRSL